MDGGGKGGFAGGVAVSCVMPVGQDENGVRLNVLQAEGSGLLGSPVVGACLAQDAQGGGVAAGLGGEVAPEAEHVCPGP